MNIIEIIRKKFPKNGWSLIRTRKEKPFGYVGYMLTIYSLDDDTTFICDIKGRNLKSLSSQLLKLKEK
ncbi:MAG: hypothetical protein AABY22_02740 [Nanoarchaeota archaeon]